MYLLLYTKCKVVCVPRCVWRSRCPLPTETLSSQNGRAESYPAAQNKKSHEPRAMSCSGMFHHIETDCRTPTRPVDAAQVLAPLAATHGRHSFSLSRGKQFKRSRRKRNRAFEETTWAWMYRCHVAYDTGYSLRDSSPSVQRIDGNLKKLCAILIVCRRDAWAGSRARPDGIRVPVELGQWTMDQH